MSILDGKIRRATKEDTELPWSGNKDNFRCGLCGDKILVNDKFRCQYTNDSRIPGTSGNPLICEDCDGTKEEIIKKLADNYQEYMQGKFWRFRMQDKRR